VALQPHSVRQFRSSRGGTAEPEKETLYLPKYAERGKRGQIPALRRFPAIDRLPAMATKPNEKEPATRLLAQNRRARHDYEIVETMEAGIALSGTEVKAVRTGKVQLKDSFVEVRNGQAWLVGVHISPYSHGNRENHLPERDRRLLLKRRQIDKIFGRSQIKGMTVVPLSVYLKGNWIKVEIAMAQGKRQYDKRQAEREKELDREVDAAIKSGKGGKSAGGAGGAGGDY
jgi:SsrA-binding protein